MKIGDVKVYREMGEQAEVEIVDIEERDGGEEFTLRVLGSVKHGGFIIESCSFKKDMIFSVWRTNGNGNAQCGWALLDKLD